MSRKWRKILLTFHLATSVGWLGEIAAYLALGVTAATGATDATVRSAWVAMNLIGWTVLVPTAVLSLASGIVVAVTSRWGLFRHYWVRFSLIVTAFSTVVLIVHMPSVSRIAATASDPAAAVTDDMRAGDLVHPSLGLLLLTAVLVMNVFKPGIRQTSPRG